ncbi:hypothetical protein RDWZM_002278 [Blomia tropicalis]|uniref:EB domain-containing protein n=1 Tax=Blomia tropicalis TaxID=40697 RepID=A0A9Q0RPS5_BLOTA|nr:hypothetical protein RDWZM_002278 [Blomia tropicalis]
MYLLKIIQIILLILLLLLFNKIQSFDGSSFRILCNENNNCPENSICYSNTCICKFGYVWFEATCIMAYCSDDQDCLQLFVYSRCNSNGTCQCSTKAYLNTVMQECINQLPSIVLWFGFVSVVLITLLIPIGVIIVRERREMYKKSIPDQRGSSIWSIKPLKHSLLQSTSPLSRSMPSPTIHYDNKNNNSNNNNIKYLLP